MKERSPNSRIKAWLAEFLLVRNKFSGPDGTPLHKYSVTEGEYQRLRELIRKSDLRTMNPVWETYWGAAYCLFVAEKYRREYDASEGGWSWKGFDNALNVRLSHQQRSHYVRQGLEYWERPLRQREGGTDYLGSLFDEGGLPWRLLQDDHHGFGRAIRAGIRRYHSAKAGGSNLVEVIRTHGIYFPKVFQTTEKYQLIASVVNWLMDLAEKYNLANCDDPSAYLDKHAQNWRARSPLPVGEENARVMVNSWLRDAGKAQEERRRAEEEARNFTCEHSVEGNLSSWMIKSEVFLPRVMFFDLSEATHLQSTRLEITFFEGDKLLHKAGVAYGKLREDETTLEVALSARDVSLTRQYPERPLTIQFLSNGQCIHASYFENSEVDFSTLPLIVVEAGGKRELVGMSSMTVAADNALVRLPNSLSFQSAEPPCLEEDDRSGRWFRLTEDTEIVGNQSRFTLRLRGQVNSTKPHLKGGISLFDTLPNLTYRGWPTAELRDEDENKVPLQLFADGVLVNQEFERSALGAFTVSVVGGGGDVLLQRRLGILPSDLQVQALPDSSSSPARIIIRSQHDLGVANITRDLNTESTRRGDTLTIFMEPQPGRALPERIALEIANAAQHSKPVTLRIPFPQLGVVLFNDYGQEVREERLVLKDLLGAVLLMTPPNEKPVTFRIVLERIGPNPHAFRRIYRYKVQGQPARVSLFSFEDDIEQILGAMPNQDSEVRMSVETDQTLRQITIARYHARLVREENGLYRLEGGDRHMELSGARIEAMRLDDPKAQSVPIPERLSAGVGTGRFEIPSQLRRHGPWLLCPEPESAIQFRPEIWVNEEEIPALSPTAIRSLHMAARLFHSTYNPTVIDGVINQMAGDMEHSGWQYLNTLREEYAGIPLSAFESWHALARNEDALARAAFRLEMDNGFCKRLSNELAVVWESVTIKSWCKAQEEYLAFISLQIDEDAAREFTQQRRNSLAACIPCFRHLPEYFQDPRPDLLRTPPLESLIPSWYQDLRRRHATDDDVPTFLERELVAWAEGQDLPEFLVRFKNLQSAIAIIYLPIFMAYVSAGKASLESLNRQLAEVRFGIRVLSDFDREQWYEPVYAAMLSHLLREHG